MATTINQAFLKLKANLESSGLQTSTVSTRQTNVREVLEAELEVADEGSFLTGSYARETMIAPLSEADIDIFVVLNPKYFHNYKDGPNGGQAGLLELVKRTETPGVNCGAHRSDAPYHRSRFRETIREFWQRMGFPPDQGGESAARGKS